MSLIITKKQKCTDTSKTIFDHIDDKNMDMVHAIITNEGAEILSIRNAQGNTPLLHALLNVTVIGNQNIRDSINKCLNDNTKIMADRLIQISQLTSDYGSGLIFMYSIIMDILSYPEYCVLDAVTVHGDTPLLIVCNDTYNQIDMISIALTMLQNYDLCAMGHKGQHNMPALMLACTHGNTRVVKAIVGNPTAYRQVDREPLCDLTLCGLGYIYDDGDCYYGPGTFIDLYRTCLSIACHHSHTDIIILLLHHVEKCELGLCAPHWEKLVQIAKDNNLTKAQTMLDELLYEIVPPTAQVDFDEFEESDDDSDGINKDSDNEKDNEDKQKSDSDSDEENDSDESECDSDESECDSDEGF